MNTLGLFSSLFLASNSIVHTGQLIPLAPIVPARQSVIESISQGVVSEILSGERELNIRQIRRLA
jgi:hypothetical protein